MSKPSLKIMTANAIFRDYGLKNILFSKEVHHVRFLDWIQLHHLVDMNLQGGPGSDSTNFGLPGNCTIAKIVLSGD